MLAIWMFSLVKGLFKYLAHFSIVSDFLIDLSQFLYIIDMSPLLGICFVTTSLTQSGLPFQFSLMIGSY